jgi:hypothetical protein
VELTFAAFMSSDQDSSVVVAVNHQDGNGGSYNSMHTTMWAFFSATQLLGAAVLHKRGDGGPTSMPIRAFSIASLMLGGGACAVGGALHASGIREVQDLVNMGQTIRCALGKPPRKQS